MYATFWRNKFLTINAKSIGEMAALLEAAAKELRKMEAAGVRLDGLANDDYAMLVTDDPRVAHMFNMIQQDEQ